MTRDRGTVGLAIGAVKAGPANLRKANPSRDSRLEASTKNADRGLDAAEPDRIESCTHQAASASARGISIPRPA